MQAIEEKGKKQTTKGKTAIRHSSNLSEAKAPTVLPKVRRAAH
jgi:hypothetical protein